MPSFQFKLYNPIKRKAQESSPEDPQPNLQQAKKRKIAGSDPFRPVIFDGLPAAVKRSSEDPQPDDHQAKKRKLSGTDPFRLVKFDACSSTGRARSGGPQRASRRQKPLKKEGREFPMEIWGHIMTYCDLSSISTLASMHPKFASWIEPASFWEERNKNYYSTTGHPPPPPAPNGTTERQYADLLEGRGCMGCSKKSKSSKTYWAFANRWCKECYSASILRMHDIRLSRLYLLRQYGLLGTIPSAHTDAWGHYAGAGRGRSRGSVTVFLRDDVQRLVDGHFRRAQINYDELVDERSAAARRKRADLAGWLPEARERMARRMEAALEVERWERERRERRREGREGMLGRRWTFFVERAESQLGLVRDVVEENEAFLRAVGVAKEPSEKAWAHLKKKLSEEAWADLRKGL